MKRAQGIVLLLGTLGGLAAGYYWGSHLTHSHPGAPSEAGARKVLYYQSAMHPWIKSDKPGKCTICGMELTPVFEGQSGTTSAEGVVLLSSNSLSVLHVQTTPVTKRSVVRSLRVAGQMEDDDTRHLRLSAFVDSRIEKLFVNYPGAEVKEGHRLAALYSPALLSAEREYMALHRRSQQSSAGSGPEIKALLDAAAIKLARMGLTPKQIEALPHKSDTESLTDLVAPVSGTVVSTELFAGQYVKEGDKLFELADFSVMWFRFDAYERDLSLLRVGQSVDVTLPALPGQTFSAAIRFIDPNLDPITRVAKVRVEIPNPWVTDPGEPRRALKHRAYAEGVVKVETPEVLALPRSAVLNPGGHPVVFADRGGGHFERLEVVLGRVGDEWVEVLDGVQEADRVVISGNLMMDAQSVLPK